MENIQLEDGFECCSTCNMAFHISDPAIYELKNHKSLCRTCFLEVYNNVSWGAKRESRLIFEYSKVSIPHKLKWEIWKRDGFMCKFCSSQDNLSIDHICPESLGGDLSKKNLQTLCRSCNSSKHNSI